MFLEVELEPSVVGLEVTALWGLDPVVVEVFFSGVLLWSMVIWIGVQMISAKDAGR